MYIENLYPIKPDQTILVLGVGDEYVEFLKYQSQSDKVS